MVKKYLYILPLIILVVTAGYATYIVSTTNIIFGTKHYLGCLFIAISLIGVFIKKSLGVYFTGITLLIGTLNVIAFTPAVEAYSFGFKFNNTSAMSIKIQAFSFLVLLLYLTLNGQFLISKLRKRKQ